MDGDGFPMKGQLRPDERVPVTRVAPSAKGEPLVRWFWVPEWHLRPGEGFETMTLPFPACQLVVEPHGVAVHGPVMKAWRRVLTGDGWAVGALLRPGAAHALVGDVAGVVDREVPIGGVDVLGQRVTAAMDSRDGWHTRHERASHLLEDWLVEAVGGEVAVDPWAVTALRVVDLADGDPELMRVDDLALRVGVPERSLQRLARTHIGMTPAAMIRRRRVQEAAQRVREEPDVDLAAIAADLGYSDHAHLTREFRRVLGYTPTGYRSARGAQAACS